MYKSVWEEGKDIPVWISFKKAWFFQSPLDSICLFACLVVHVVSNEVSQRQTDVSHAVSRLRISRGIYSHWPWGVVGIG